MNVTLLKCKLHNAAVTAGDVNYQGSLGVSRELMKAVGLLPYEKILVANLTNGERLETYAIVEETPGQIVLNGAAAHRGQVGDRVIIMSFAQLTVEAAQAHQPRIAILNEHNEIIELK
ncbi:aspartate 1-decarboxylase [bacterium]|nr:aspartate 1-decarboxylase [bacterium]